MNARPLALAAVVALTVCAPSALRAQDADQKEIVAVVRKLFDGMRARDTASMRALFVPQARMIGISQQGEVRADPIDGWLNGVGRPGPSVLDERVWGEEVRVDGAIAQAWMQYAFYVGERLNHCGVDAFDFVKVGGAWKIVGVMDTRRTTGCTPPPR